MDQRDELQTGDLLTVHARPSGDCNLTVIAVEADGLATVLFPNDTTVDNRVQAGALVQIPAEGAPFQLRLDKPGRHTIAAVCNAIAKRPQGIGHDFERQRFTVLGDWRTFLLQSAEREAEYQRRRKNFANSAPARAVPKCWTNSCRRGPKTRRALASRSRSSETSVLEVAGEGAAGQAI